MLEEDFNNLLVVIIKKDGEKCFVFENDIFHYHADALNYLYNKRFKKFYEKRIVSRDVMDYLKVFKGEVVILNKGHGNGLFAITVLPDYMTEEQVSSLKDFEEIFKKATLIVKSILGEALFEADECVSYTDSKKYVKYN